MGRKGRRLRKLTHELAQRFPELDDPEATIVDGQVLVDGFPVRIPLRWFPSELPLALREPTAPSSEDPLPRRRSSARGESEPLKPQPSALPACAARVAAPLSARHGRRRTSKASAATSRVLLTAARERVLSEHGPWQGQDRARRSAGHVPQGWSLGIYGGGEGVGNACSPSRRGP